MVSVVIPTYNRGYIIKRAIDSVLNQTYRDIEVIVVDDGSADNTEEVVIAISDVRLRYYRLERNYGACYARNYGIDKSVGEYVTFQDSDDVWEPLKLEKQLNTLEVNNADVVFCSHLICGEEGKFVAPERYISETEMHGLLLSRNVISTQTILGKRKCLIKEPFDPGLPRCQDWDLMIRLSRYYKVTHLHEPLVKVYIQQDSISRNPEKALTALERMREKYLKWLEPENEVSIYNLMGYYALLAGKPCGEYYKNAWCLKKNPKYLLMVILDRAKLARLAESFKQFKDKHKNKRRAAVNAAGE